MVSLVANPITAAPHFNVRQLRHLRARRAGLALAQMDMQAKAATSILHTPEGKIPSHIGARAAEVVVETKPLADKTAIPKPAARMASLALATPEASSTTPIMPQPMPSHSAPIDGPHEPSQWACLQAATEFDFHGDVARRVRQNRLKRLSREGRRPAAMINAADTSTAPPTGLAIGANWSIGIRSRDADAAPLNVAIPSTAAAISPPPGFSDRAILPAANIPAPLAPAGATGLSSTVSTAPKSAPPAKPPPKAQGTIVAPPSPVATATSVASAETHRREIQLQPNRLAGGSADPFSAAIPQLRAENNEQVPLKSSPEAPVSDGVLPGRIPDAVTDAQQKHVGRVTSPAPKPFQPFDPWQLDEIRLRLWRAYISDKTPKDWLKTIKDALGPVTCH